MATSTLRHVVLFKFKDGTSPADVKKIEEEFYLLPSKISEIKSFEWGLNVSKENFNELGLTHCYLLTFSSQQDLDTYIAHEEHQKFVKNFAGPHADKVTVVDFWAKS